MEALRAKLGLVQQQVYQKVDAETLLKAKERRYRDSEEDSERSTEDDSLRSNRAPHQKRLIILTIGLLFFMVLSLLLLGAYVLKKPSDRECGIQTGVFCGFSLPVLRDLNSFVDIFRIQAPANEAVEYVEMDFVNPFAHDTIYRGPPTPELEKAWEELWYCR
jgi:hypothetical protein